MSKTSTGLAAEHLVIPFPDRQPDGFDVLADEPAFDPDRHLQLEHPTQIVELADLGYPADEIATKATSVAATSPFRILSVEGARVLLDVARRLEPSSRPAGTRIRRSVRGGCYCSRWLRDLCLCADVSDHLSDIYGVRVAPHPMPHQLGHLNYAPPVVEENIDKWHHDTLTLDYVLPVTDPTTVAGGRFEYFVGTKTEASQLAQMGRLPPPDRIVAPHFPGPGWAIALHGDMVVHRAARLLAPSERISMVNGYVSLDTSTDDQTRHADLIGVDADHVLYVEWARYAAWRAGDRLATLIRDLGFGESPEAVAQHLETSVADVVRAAAEMRAGQREIAHYGG